MIINEWKIDDKTNFNCFTSHAMPECSAEDGSRLKCFIYTAQDAHELISIRRKARLLQLFSFHDTEFFFFIIL